MHTAKSRGLDYLLKRDKRLVVVLDDDPTGTQTFSDVAVLLRTDAASLREAVRRNDSCFFVLTNTRAMDERAAVSLLRHIKRHIDEACAEIGRTPCYVLRGDSTLRGHVFAEMDVFREPRSVGLFVPAFPECGRLTVGGVHYLDTGGVRRPVADTEFARDTVFGYTSESLTDWVKEKSPRWQGRTLPLAAIRGGGGGGAGGGDAVAEALLGAEPGTVLLPDAEQPSDIAAIVRGLLMAEAAGCSVVVRCASTLASIRCGKRSVMVRPQPGAADGGLLVVCGSHTAMTTRQLAALADQAGANPVVVDTGRILGGASQAVVREAAERVIEALGRQKLAILASERLRDARYGDLNSGAAVMDALTGVVAAAAGHYSAVIAKGGITSAQVAVDGLGAVAAQVEGQLETGISLWTLRLSDGARLPYAVIPGNIGDERTLLRICACMRGSDDSPGDSLA